VVYSQLNKTLHVIGKYLTGKCDYCQETDRGACIETVRTLLEGKREVEI
jgi:predicted nucleic acid binding AN1-type Zn finger protein